MNTLSKLASLFWTITTLILLVFSFVTRDKDLVYFDSNPSMQVILGSSVAFWILSAVYLLYKLLRASEFRDGLFLTITKANERDEREMMISGEAARKSIVTTMVAIFIIMGASLVNVKVAKRHDPNLEKPGYVQVGLGIAKVIDHKNETVMFEYNLSKYPPFIFVLALLVLMLSSYRYNFKKLSNLDELA